MAASERLEVSYRQVKRLWRRYRRAGPGGLVHGNVGRVSSQTKPAPFRERVVAVVREPYGGTPDKRFGPRLTTEHRRADHDLAVHPETLRRWMLAAGLWSRRRCKRKPHRSRREPKAHFGELLQPDGSIHDWLEQRGPRACLINLVDDATGVAMCRFSADDLGSGGSARSLGAALRRAAGDLHRLGERLCAAADRARSVRRRRASND